MSRIIIVGGGASGMMAAILLREKKHDVVVLERNTMVMKKIYATGNGRCNFTNEDVDVVNYHGENPKFVTSAIKRFGYYDTIDFFNRIGIKEIVLDQGKVYPISLQASCVPKLFLSYAHHLGVEIRNNCYVKSVDGKALSIELDTGEKIYGDKIIIATGGEAMAKSGSDGNGYRLCSRLGHGIIPTHPGIVQLKLKVSDYKNMVGTKFPGKVYLCHNNRKFMEQTSDVLFTDYGISGPGILQISGEAVRLIRKGERVFVSIDVIPSIDENYLYEILLDNVVGNGYKPMEEILMGLVHDNLIGTILKYANIQGNIKASQVSKESIHNLSRIIKDFRFEVDGFKSNRDGQVTCGGIDTRELNSKTMESKICPNVYILGELMDVDGDCGGYNLQWAWASANACSNSID